MLFFFLRLLTLLLFPLPFLNQTQAQKEDPCAALAQSKEGSSPDFRPSSAWACLSSVPFVSQVRDNVLEVVSKSYDLDIYEFNNLKTPPPLTQATDVRAEIQRMSTQNYKSDFEFQYDLWQTIHGLNDGHRGWVSCYQSAFITLQTLPLVSLARSSLSSNSSSNSSSGDAAIFIVPDAVELTAALGFTKIYKDTYNVDVSELAGMEVTKIDGMDPWVYIDNIADTETGTYQDRNVRRSATLSSYAADGAASGNSWYRAIGSLARPAFPTRDNITYEVNLTSGKKENVMVPYFALPTVTFTTAEDFFTEHCLLPSANSTSSSRRDLGASHPVSIAPRQDSSPSVCKPATTKQDFPLANSPGSSSAYIGGRWSQFYVLPTTDQGDQGKVGVIYITTFSPDVDEETSNCVEAFAEEVAAGMANFTKLGVERVIIDTTDDGGGFIALSMLWQRVFAGEGHESSIGFDGVYRDADLYNKFTAAGTKEGSLDMDPFFGASGLTNAEGKPFPANHDIFASGGSTLDINGKQLTVTEVVRDGIDNIQKEVDSLIKNPSKPPFAFENLLIFSNGGTCGSACSLLTTFLNIELKVDAHLATARPDETLEYSSFAAQAFNTDSLYKEIAATGVASDPSAPPPLLVFGKFAFPIRGFYFPNSTDFVQYKSMPADKTFALTAEEYLDPLKMYAKAAQSKWGGSLPASNSNNDATNSGSTGSSEKGVLGLSKNTTIKVAVGVVSAALVAGVASLIFYFVRRRTRRAQLGRYVEVDKSTAPLGSFELDHGRPTGGGYA